ncbi:unnamed protein product [Rotaria sp. Silwood2]|nr:unnamed protein product [Rotaria sp. Silwood2]CAF4399425.1 unnamed protein product [Rotaria sp. Silwood2]
MDPSVYCRIIPFFIISILLFNTVPATVGTTRSSETDNETEKISYNREIHKSRRLTVQNFILIWLDSKINESNSDYHNSMKRFREIVNTIYTFTNADQCVDFLNEVKDEKVFLILSDDFIQSTVSVIHDIPQLDSIYVISGNGSKHEQCAKQWTKMRSVYTKMGSIINALKLDAQQCDRDSLLLSITSGHLDQVDPVFMYANLLKKTLMEIKYDGNAKKEFADFCRKQYQNNSYELQKINAFERDYSLDAAIWWYAQKCFLYQMINRALRTQEIEIIFKMGFFLRDVHRQIEELNSEKTRKSSVFFVYRGQGILSTEFERVKRTSKGDLLVFNNFLHGSLNKKLALQFARNSLRDPDLVGVLFNITINNTRASSSPFVSRRQADALANEKEGILFSMFTIFQITDIMPIENRLWQVELTLMPDNDQKQIKLLELTRKEASKSNGWQQLGDLLMRMRNFDKAEEAYHILLQKMSKVDEKALPHLYNQLGRIKHRKKQYMEALEFYEKALEIQQKSFPSKHLDLASTYTNIGLVHSSMEEYTKALDFYRKALEIQEDLLPSDHQNLVTTYNNIGLVYKNMGEYSTALEFYQKTLEIQEKSLSSNHRDFAMTYNNIASAHYNIKDYWKALLFYKKALKIYKKYFPEDHPYLATMYHNIGSVHRDMEEYSTALEYFKKELEIREKSIPSNHPTMSSIYSCMGMVHAKMEQYLKALEFYQKALEIQQKTLSANHPDLAAIYYYVGSVYQHMQENSKALSFFERAVEVGQLSLPENHSDLELYRKHLYELQHEL